MKTVNYTTTKIALNDYETKTLKQAVAILRDIYEQAPEDTRLEKMIGDAYDDLDTLLDEGASNSELDTEMCWTAEEYNEVGE